MATNSHQVTTLHHRQRYQGYPYVNPPAFGVPSIDPHTAARWASLPRRPIQLPLRVHDQAGGSGTPAKQASNTVISPDSGTSTIKSDIADPDDDPVVYIDLPDDSQTSEVIRPDSGTSTIKSDPDENPVVYIDLPDDNESDIVHRREESKTDDLEEHVVYIDMPEASGSELCERRELWEEGPSASVVQSKTDDLEEPVVYIDMPEASGSELCERRELCEEGPSASVVQDTILFDQFKNRRIVIAPANNASESDAESTVGTSHRTPQQRPPPPDTLNIYRGDSGHHSYGSPQYLSPEDYRHRGISPEDDFRLPPLPISSFPDPPPAYSEIDQTPAPVTSPASVTSPAPITTPPGNDQRTTVIINSPSGNSNRKYMACKHCGMMVHSLVVKQVSFLTHVLAISMFFIGLFPIAILVYCFGYFKSKQHYCPNCTKMMTSEDPCKICC